MTGAERILEMLTAFGVLARLRQMQRPAVILADPGLIPALAEDAVPDQAHLVPVIGFETADLPGDATGPYVVVTAGDELALKQRLRRVLALRGQRVAIYGALQDLVPMAIGDDESFEPAGLEAKWESFSLTPSLIVTCTPRSGSQFVVRKFQEAGIGAPRDVVDLTFDAFDKEGGGALASWMLLSGNEDALDPIVDAIHDLVDELHAFGSGSMREVTLSLVLMALGDALMGEPLSQALNLPRHAARDQAEKLLVEAALAAGLLSEQN